ncbi:hypothetical protein [Stenotrophomonas sp.]|uniref:hypothetical protein n=1 Tax=Stenotrophomonas sp. TaxID=69392 RepID=UPI0028ACB7BF|nr:hypothetical protein [Stenotrophomonas sp.]
MAFDWTTNPLANTPWRIQVVADIVPILIRRAKEGRRITYGDLAIALHNEFGHEPKARKTLYGPPVGAVGQVIQSLGEKWGEVIPPINTIVVEADTKLPSTGADEIAHYFFEDNGAGMEQDRHAYIEAAMKAVFDYGHRWDRVADALGAPTLETASGVIDKGDPIELPKLPRAYGVESSAHKALKAWIVANPDRLYEYGPFKTKHGENEHCISSGDRLDAYFDNGRLRLAVEVKASNACDDELMRGVYQCIKYRAVLRAEQHALRRSPNGDAVLVSTKVPGKKVRALMKRLLVGFVLAPMEAEQG